MPGFKLIDEDFVMRDILISNKRVLEKEASDEAS